MFTIPPIIIDNCQDTDRSLATNPGGQCRTSPASFDSHSVLSKESRSTR